MPFDLVGGNYARPYRAPSGYWGNPLEDETDSPALQRRKQAPISPEEQESWTRTLARTTGGMIENLGWVLDTPGAAMRGVLAGDPLSIFSLDPDRRVSGTELAQSYGVLKEDDNPWLKAGVGLATEVLTDPLAFITGPMTSLNKAGKAAKAAGILDLAPYAAQKAMGRTQAAKTMTGAFTDAAYESLAPLGLARNVENYRVRPLLGPRLARTKATLEDVVQAADNPGSALEAVTQYLSKTGDTYDAVKGERLGGGFGIGLPFGDAAVTFTPPGGEKLLDAMDLAGQAIGWSYPGRLASSVFDKRVAMQTDPMDQMASLRRAAAVEGAEREGRRKAVQHAMTVSEIPMTPTASALLGSDSLFSREGNDFLTRLFENKPTANDLRIKAELPGIEAAVDSWDSLRRSMVDQSRALGMRMNRYGDKYGTLYSPRRADEINFEDYGRGVGRSMYMTSTAEQYSQIGRAHV